MDIHCTLHMTLQEYITTTNKLQTKGKIMKLCFDRFCVKMSGLLNRYIWRIVDTKVHGWLSLPFLRWWVSTVSLTVVHVLPSPPHSIHASNFTPLCSILSHPTDWKRKNDTCTTTLRGLFWIHSESNRLVRKKRKHPYRTPANVNIENLERASELRGFYIVLTSQRKEWKRNTRLIKRLAAS